MLCAGGCDDGATEAADATSSVSRCGEGLSRVALGIGEPFAPFGDDPHVTIEQGRQGGYHVFVSAQVFGPIDPDHVDIEIALRRGDWRISRHLTLDWLLHLGPGGAYCEYPRAQLVLQDEAGGLLPYERLAEITGVPLRIDVGLRSPGGDAEGSFTLTLDPLPPDL